MSNYLKCLSILAVAGLLGSCSLVVESGAIQCVTDADCTRFAPHPSCIKGVCVETGLGPAGCFAGSPQNDSDYLNTCSTATCVPFDNCARLGLCNTSELPPLVPRP